MVVLRQIFVWGFIAILWFSPLARASWDLWAVTFIHNLTLLLLVLWFIQKSIATEDTESTEKQEILKGPKVLNSILSVFFREFRGKKFSFPTKIEGAILVFILIAGISAINSEDFATSRNELFNLLNYVLLYYLILTLTDKDKRLIIRSLLAIGGVISLIGIYQFIKGTEVASTLVKSNILAGYLIMLIPIGISQVVSHRSLGRWATKRSPCIATGEAQDTGHWSSESSGGSGHLVSGIWYLVSVILMLICLLLTGSLGAILALGGVMVGMGFWFFRNRPLKQRLVWLLIVGILLLGGGVLFVRKLDSPELLNRVWWWQTAIRMSKSHPFLGVGPGAFESMYLKYKLWGKSSLYAHNYFLQITAEMGLFGLSAFLGILVCFFRSPSHLVGGLRRKSQSPITDYCEKLRNGAGRLPITGLTAGIAAVLLHNLVDYNLCIPANAILFWTILALARRSTVDGPRSTVDRRWTMDYGLWTVLLVIVLAIVFLVGIKVNKIFLANRQYACSYYAKSNEERLLRLKKAIILDPKVAQYHIALGDFYLQQREFSHAEERYLKAIRCQPFIAFWHHKLGELYILKNNYEKAREEFLKTISLCRDNPRYWVKLADVYEKEGDLEAARYNYQIARKLER